MFMNEKGQTLLTVMLISLIFTVLGLTILAASINGATRTQIRVNDIELATESSNTLNNIIAEFRNEVTSSPYKLTDAPVISSLLSDLRNKLLAKNKGLCILDLTSAGGSCEQNGITTVKGYGIDPAKSFTRVYEFSFKGQDGNLTKVVNKTVILSPTPSFLNYAVGSGPSGVLNLNGAAEIRGNLYANSLKTTNVASYKDSNSSSTSLTSSDTLYPRLEGKGIIRGDLNGTTNFSDTESLKKYFDSRSQAFIQHETNDFIDVKFNDTLAQVLNGVTSKGTFNASDFTTPDNVNRAVTRLLSPCLPTIKSWFPTVVGGKIVQTAPIGTCPISANSNGWKPIKVIEENLNYSDIENLIPVNGQTIVYSGIKSDGKIKDKTKEFVQPLYIQKNLNLNGSWLVVNGDLVIVGNSANHVKIQGKILVLGNVSILGNNSKPDGSPETEEDDNIDFDATIYSLGKATISNTNINGLEEKQLVLMARDDLSINRINEFKDTTSQINPLQAFFYTDANAELYGVGSLFKIKGGLFANNILTVNAIRQNSIQRSASLKDKISAPGTQASQDSRFQVDYDASVLLDQIDALPKTDYYQVIMENTLIN